MERRSAKPGRGPRSDALRNRERLIEAATRVFGAGRPQASLEAVAREAGVGIGTLYRHFPTREALFEAVYRREVDGLVELAGQLAQDPSPIEALRQWLHANVRLAATKRGMVEALQLAAFGSDLKAYSFSQLTGALGDLMDRAVSAGQLRADLSAEDLLRALVGAFYVEAGNDWQAAASRIVNVLVEGLRQR